MAPFIFILESSKRGWKSPRALRPLRFEAENSTAVAGAQEEDVLASRVTQQPVEQVPC